MSAILGINAFGQNPSACLVVDGRLLAFSHEERFNRIKGSEKLFPSYALNWCLSSNNLTLQDVDKIAVNWDCNKYPGVMLMSILRYNFGALGKNRIAKSGTSSGLNSLIDSLYLYSPRYYKQRIVDSLRESGYRGIIPQIQYINHHISHAYQAFYQSGFHEAAVLIADGHGEEDCVSGYLVKDGVFKRVMHYPIPYSLGWFYGAFTAYLGFRANLEEGKLMGLAAYGESRKKDNPWLQRLDRILKVHEHGYEISPHFFKMGLNDYHPRFTNELVEFITSFDSDLTPIGVNEKSLINGEVQNRYLMDKYIDLAYAVQTRLEEAVLCLTKELKRSTGADNLCLAGGIFMNCKANSVIWSKSGVKQIFIHPASSDDGSAIGAALFAAEATGCNVHNPLKSAQLGASYTNDEVISCLNSFGITYKVRNDICMDVAELVSKGKFVGWFDGAAEMGARALGGRSIVASPTISEINNSINKHVKRRELWRPYCPSINFDDRIGYLEDGTESPFMIIANKATQELTEIAPAIVHVDQSVRPQTVRKEILPKWHHFIESVAEITGHPIILNTSFNASGEPIVNSPYDAIRTFYSTGLHALAMEDILIIK